MLSPSVRSLVALALSCLGVAISLVSGCGLSVRGAGPDGASGGPDAEASPNDAPSSTDSTVVDARSLTDSSTTDASGPPGCVTLSNGIAPFDYEGDTGGYTVNSQGVTLGISSGKKAALFHTFDAGKIYTRSSVDLHLGVLWDSGSWGPNNTDYTTLLQQFYGATRSASTSARHDVTMAHNVLDLDVWAPNQQTYGLGGMTIPGADVHVVIETKWASTSPGSATVSMTPAAGVTSWSLNNIATAVTGPTDKLTVVIGGSGMNAVPNLRLVVYGVCLAFDP